MEHSDELTFAEYFKSPDPMEHSDELTFADCFHAQKELYRAIISAAVSIRWMIEHDFEVPTDADLRQMEAEVNRELCDAWLEIYVLALREWLDGQ